jgi:signal transduction histidine kinase
MLEPLQWQFLADEEAWQVELNDEASRNLFLYYREALHNLLRHSKAKQATIHVSVDAGSFLLRISDDGMGIPEAKLERASTLRALRQRAEALAANFTVDTSESAGTKLNLSVPIELHRARDAAGA